MTEERRDVLRYPEADPEHRATPAGDGERIVAAHRNEARKQRYVVAIVGAVVAGAAGLFAAGYVGQLGGVAVAVAVLLALLVGHDDPPLPELVAEDVPLADAVERYDAMDAVAADGEAEGGAAGEGDAPASGTGTADGEGSSGDSV